MNQILEWSKGNPGALTFLLQLLNCPVDKLVQSIVIMSTLEKAESIRGTNAWVLYSDLCDKDMDKVEKLCSKCPINILEDACKRQDRSGKQLVAVYLTEEA